MADAPSERRKLLGLALPALDHVFGAATDSAERPSPSLRKASGVRRPRVGNPAIDAYNASTGSHPWHRGGLTA